MEILISSFTVFYFLLPFLLYSRPYIFVLLFMFCGYHSGKFFWKKERKILFFEFVCWSFCFFRVCLLWVQQFFLLLEPQEPFPAAVWLFLFCLKSISMHHSKMQRYVGSPGFTEFPCFNQTKINFSGSKTVSTWSICWLF